MTDQQAKAPPGPKIFYGWVIVGSSLIMLFALACTLYSYGIFFKSLQDEFGWSRTMTSSVVTSYWICHFIFAMPAGWLSDRFGPRRVLLACNLMAGTGLILMSQVTSLWQMYLFFGVMIGCGLAGTFAILSATAARWFVRRRGLALGLVACGSGIGTMVIGPVVHSLITSFGWRDTYLIIGISVLIALMIPAFFIYREPKSLGLLPYGQPSFPAGEDHPGGPSAEKRAKKARPAVDEGLPVAQVVRSAHFWIMMVIFSIFFLTTQLTMAHLYNHATDIGISGTVAAGFLSVLGVGSLVGRLVVGAVSDRFGSRLGVILCFLLTVVSFTLVVFAHSSWMFLLFGGLFGLAYGGEMPLIPGLSTHYFGLKSLGFIVGALIAGGSLGGALGPILGGLVFDLTGGYTLAFALAAGLNLLALALMCLPSMKQPAYETRIPD